MITATNLRKVLNLMGFLPEGTDVYTKHYANFDCDIRVDFKNGKIEYPQNLNTGDNTTTNFSENENFVVLECVDKLLVKGYSPDTIFLEKEWTLGHTQKGGRADITVYKKDENCDKSTAYLIIECKRADTYKAAQKELFNDPAGKQLFSYWAQARSTQWLQLYASDYDEKNDEITFKEEIVRSFDDKNVELLAKEDESVLLYKNASTAEDFFVTWEETYSKKTYHNIIFGDDAVAYNIGNVPIKNKDLKKFDKNDGITDRFREILRHNSISDKENAFNKLLSLFICKFVDEEKHGGQDDIMHFQYVDGTDDYYTLYERLLALFQIGMDEYLKESVFYLDNDYIRKTLNDFTGKRRAELENELVTTFQKTKMLSCQVFAFREVYNEKLFLQNGKVLVEVVELFQNYRLAYTSKQQFLGELFENLLDQGFKQEAGQFFTPIPITRFVWNSLPLERYMQGGNATVPKVIDFACGSGHFLTEGISAISDYAEEIDDKEISKNFYGIEKDNRLARVSKVAMLLNGASNANIKAADGLEHDEVFLGELNSFDILVANPPYSVDAFKTHESRRVQNTYETIKLMSFSCGDIQNVFVERMHYLLKPKGIAAIVMPDSLLHNHEGSDIKTREILLHNFYIRAIACFGGQTFGKTSVATNILFLEHFDFPPQKAHLLKDSVNAILSGEDLQDWNDEHIFDEYLKTIAVQKEAYCAFAKEAKSVFEDDFAPYFADYKASFMGLTSTKKALEKIAETERRELSNEPLKKNEKPSREQKEILTNEFYAWAKDCEKTKLLIFALTYNQHTLIIHAPTDIAEQKKFLGYKNSERRGDEGLKENGGLLTNPADRADTQKLAWLVRQAFSCEQTATPELEKYVSYARSADMFDFSRPNFDMEIKTSVESESGKMRIESKYPLVRLGEILTFVTQRINSSEIKPSDYVTTDTMLQNRMGITDFEGELNDTSVVEYHENDILISNIRPYLKKIWFANKNGGCSPDVLVFRPINNDQLLAGYAFIILSMDSFFDFIMANVKGIKMPRGDKNLIPSYEIPLPPLDIQRNIISECETIDTEYQNAQTQIVDCKMKISSIMSDVHGNTKSLKEICSVINPSKSDIRTLSDDTLVSFVDMSSVSNDGFIEKKNDRQLGDLRKGSYTYFAENDIIIAKITPCMENGKCALARNLTNKIGMGSSEFHVFRIKTDYSTDFVFYFLNRAEIRKEAQKNMTGASGHRRVPISFYEDLRIPLPPLEEQHRIVSEITALESQIATAKQTMAECPARKQAVLDKWLR